MVRYAAGDMGRMELGGAGEPAGEDGLEMRRRWVDITTGEDAALDMDGLEGRECAAVSGDIERLGEGDRAGREVLEASKEVRRGEGEVETSAGVDGEEGNILERELEVVVEEEETRGGCTVGGRDLWDDCLWGGGEGLAGRGCCGEREERLGCRGGDMRMLLDIG